MTYQRVIPRDLFNESKLLKCLGQLSLAIHDGTAPSGLTIENTGRQFEIDQRQSEGGLYVRRGLRVMIGRVQIELYSSYNSKSPYPLICVDEIHGDVDVFNDDGSFSDEFLSFVQQD